MDASVPRECWRRCLKYPSSGICVAAVSEGKKMVVTETGWSSRVLRSVVDVTSPANQAEFFSNFIQMDHSKNFGFNCKAINSDEAVVWFGEETNWDEAVVYNNEEVNSDETLVHNSKEVNSNEVVLNKSKKISSDETAVYNREGYLQIKESTSMSTLTIASNSNSNSTSLKSNKHSSLSSSPLSSLSQSLDLEGVWYNGISVGLVSPSFV
ncbi:hypothetical protein PC121_g10017 [Phytophthora cactorum]|nr:hypothetical protein PC121_g10017 [Phytophthora cactorum]